VGGGFGVASSFFFNKDAVTRFNNLGLEKTEDYKNINLIMLGISSIWQFTLFLVADCIHLVFS